MKFKDICDTRGQQEDHDPFNYVIDDHSLAISMRGHYELAELLVCVDALREANRKYLARSWVEVVKVHKTGAEKCLMPHLEVRIWNQGEYKVHDAFFTPVEANSCVEGLTGDYGLNGWLKEKA